MVQSSLYVEGLEWYPKAYAIAKDVGNGDVKLGAGLLAAISPQMPWNRNVQLARNAMKGDWRGFTKDKYEKCRLILDGVDPYLVLRGWKVRSFYANILGYWDHVTVDTWMIQAYTRKADYPATANRTNRKGRKLYKRVADRIRREARVNGLAPAQWQAIVWCHVRQSAN